MQSVIKNQCTVLQHSAFLFFLTTLADQTHGVSLEYTTEGVSGKTRIYYTLTCDTVDIAREVTDKIAEALPIYGG